MKPIRSIISFLAAFSLADVGATTLYWDSNNSDPGSGDLEGVWETGGAGWNVLADGTGADANFTAGNSVVFSAGTDGITAKTITILDTVATPSIVLDDPCMLTLSGGTIAIGGGSTFDTSVLGAATGQSLTWNPVITGTGGLTLKAHGNTTDAGGASNSELTLSGTNDFTGTISITAGLVGLSSSFGNAANGILLNGGGLVDENQNLSTARGIQIGAAGGILRTGTSSTTTFSGPVSNASGVATTTLRHTEGGTLRLAGSGSGFTGTLTNARGDLQITGPNASWLNTAFNLDLNGGNLTFNGGGTARAASIAVINKNTSVEGGTTLDVPAYSILPTASSGQAALIGANATVDGAITSSTGTLTLTNGQFASGLMGSNSNIVNVAIVNAASSPPLVLVKNNNNDLQLARANTYSGGTTINAGRLNATVSGGFGTGTVTVKSGAQAYLSAAGATYANDFDLTGSGVVDGATDKGALRLGSSTATGVVTINAAGARIGVTTALAGRLTGSLTGSGPLEINSSGSGLNGTLTLAGSGSGYTGTLNVSQGRFNFNGTLGGSVVVAPTATATTLGGGTAISGNLTLNSTTKTVTFANSNGTLAVGGNLVLTGTNVISLAKPAPGTTNVTLMTYGGTLTGTAANLSMENAASYRGTPVFDVATSGQIRITGLNGQNLTWSGASGAWDIESTANWNSGSTTFSFGDAVTFNDTGTTKTVVMASTLEPQSVTFNNSAGNDYTINGTSASVGGLAGSMGLTKSGTGVVTLAGTNSHTGAINVSGGRLKMGSQAAFGMSSGISITAGGQVDINGQTPGNSNTGTNGYTYTIAGDGNDTTGSIVNTGANVDSKAAVKTLVLSADASLGTATRFDVGTDTKAGIGSVNGAGFLLTKKGTGDVYFRGPASNFRLMVSAGKAVAMDTDLAFGGASGAVTVASGGQLATSGSRTIATPVTLNDGSTLSNLAAGTGIWTGMLTAAGAFTADTTSGEIAIRGGVTGTGILTKAGSNALILDGITNPFAGKIVVTAGTLRASSDAALGAIPASLVPDAITLNGGSLTGGNAAGAGSATLGHPNRGIMIPGIFTWDTGAGNTLTLNSPVTGTGNMSTAANTGAVVFNQPVAVNGNFSVVTTGTASFNNGLVLSGTGEVIVDSGGTANFGSAANPTTFRVRTGTVNVGPGAAVSATRLVANDNNQTVGTINQTGGTVTITGTDSTNATTASFLLGHWPSTGFNYNLSGGTLASPGATLAIGWDSSNVNVNQTGGTANLLGINLNNTRNNSAAYNLTGGRLNLGASGITANAAKSVNLGGGTLGAYADWSSSQPIAVTGAAGDSTINTLDAVDGITPRTIILSGDINNSGGLVKTGAGTLSLEVPVSNFYGTCAINGGTLRVGGDVSQASFTVNAGGTIAPGTTATTGPGSVGNLHLDNGTASFRLSNTNGDKLVVSDTDGFTVTSPSTISAVSNTALAVNDVFPVIDYEGAIGGLGLAGLTLQMANPHYSGVLVENTANTTVDVKITAAYPVVWKGNVDGNWDLNTTANWQLEGPNTAANFLDYDSVKFTNAGSARPNVTLAGTIKPSAVTIDASVNYELTGQGITGACGLTKSNTGKFTLANANTYTGSTTINAGTLEIGNGGTTGTLGSTAITNQATLAINRGDAVTFANVIAGSGQVVKRGAGELSLTGASTFSGQIVVEAGTLTATNAPTAFGTTAGGITVQSGATFNVNGQTTPVGETVTAAGTGVAGYAVTGAGTLPANINLTANTTMGGDVVASLNLGTGTAPVTITGGRTLTKAGVSRIWYRGPENGTGNSLAALVITGGTFGIETGNNALNAVPITVGSGAVLSSWGSPNGAAATTQNNPITLNGGALASDYDGQTWSGPVVLTANSLLGAGGSGQDFTISNVISQSGGAFGLTQTMDSIVTLSGVNTYTGNTTVNLGTIILADNAGLKFTIGANGVNNRITGAGTATLNGDFTLDLSGAAIASGNSWTLVNTTTKSFGTTFTVIGFTEAADVWTKIDGTMTWTFTESTGVLTLSSNLGYNSWVANFPTLPVDQRDADDDYDADGLNNLLEYTLGGSPLVADAATVAPAGVRSGGNFVVTFKRSDQSEADTTQVLQYGTDVAGWTNIPIGASPGAGMVAISEDTPTAALDTVTVTIPTAGAPKFFVRLKVTKP